MSATAKFPLISVYIVNHNYGRYVEQAIESVLAQTCDDFELLIIDNGSTDNSREIISRYSNHGKVVTLFQDNIGLNRTNNVAIDETTGRYVMRLDADDYLHENALEVLSGILDRRDDVGLVFPDYYLVDAEGRLLDVVRRHDFNEVTLLDQPAHGACTMIRRECLRALNGYDESYHCQDGWDLWVRFIGRYGVTNVNLPLFYYRQHGDNLTGNEERILTTRSAILDKASRLNGHRPESIAVIPDRGPSLDPRSVALKPLAGKPVMDWTIDAALEAKRVSRVLVTSPDQEVLAHVRQTYGDRVAAFERDWQLALPQKSLDETLTALFNSLPDEWRDFDAVTLLFVDSPFRTARHIDSAVDMLETFDCNRVIGVRRVKEVLYCHQGKGMQPLRESGFLHQESDEVYRAVGSLMVIRRGHLFRDTNLDRSIGHLELEERAAHRIFSEWSWQIAEAMAEDIVAAKPSAAGKVKARGNA